MRKAVSSSSNNNKKGISIDSTTKDTGDVQIAPSTSTFTLSGKDDKPEKLKKKAKNFFDERQKIKARAQSLWSFIGKNLNLSLFSFNII
jgi:hypothetical protein